MITSWNILGIVGAAAVAVMFAAPARGDDATFGFRGKAPRPVVSQQQQFFAQPVFPHSNFSQTQSIMPYQQPAFSTGPVYQPQTWVTPAVNNYLPPLFYSGYQPGFYVAPTYYTYSPAYSAMPTTVYQTPQPTNAYYHDRNDRAPGFGGPQARPNIGLLGRW